MNADGRRSAETPSAYAEVRHRSPGTIDSTADSADNTDTVGMDSFGSRRFALQANRPPHRGGLHDGTTFGRTSLRPDKSRRSVLEERATRGGGMPKAERRM